jgi:hypothetical protein
MPMSNEQIVFARPGTHLFSPITGITLRTSDPAPPLEGGTLYFMLSTENKLQLKVVFATGSNTLTTATARVLAQSS